MLQHYQQQVDNGLLRFDEAQWQVLQQLATRYFAWGRRKLSA
jgi:hypothetical protein